VIGTAARQPIFEDVVFGRECIDLLDSTLRGFKAVDYAHCLMPDHVHLLIAVGQGSLIDCVAQWKSRCYKARRCRGNPAPFWQRSFWDHGLRRGEDVDVTAMYILHNPVRAGLVADWRDYPLSGSGVWNVRD
jgi:REP element-mobilizing transposase RayT